MKKQMITHVVFGVFLSALTVSSHAETSESIDVPFYRMATAPLEERVEDLLKQLTLEEKVALCYGSFYSGGVPRLNIPQLAMLDGRQGLRSLEGEHNATLLPCVLALSCTWNEDAAREFGNVLAREMLSLDRHVLLAPMLNLVRSPLGGRNFENFGEDPYLVGSMGAAYIQGVQDLGVGACSCLLVANDCEHRRHFTSSEMDERALRELHLLPYEMSVRKGKVWSMMSGNNLFRGIPCAENCHVIQDLIKDEIGFDGVMITDWRAAYNTVPTAKAGTDMTTGFCGYVYGDHLLSAVKSGEVSMDLLDEKVRRVLRLYIRCNVLNPEERLKGELDTPAHRDAARRLAAEGMVLLKNENGQLPLEIGKLKSILITGPAAEDVLLGGGSGYVQSSVKVSPVQGLQTAFGDKVTISHLAHTIPLSPVFEEGAVEWKNPRYLKKGKMVVPDAAALTKAAKAVDTVVFLAAGALASEGRDLPDMDLPGGQAEAIETLLKANKNVVVVLVNNGAVSLQHWGDKVPAILSIHYSGQATGDALIEVLTGKVNPSGKLSYTFAERLEDYPCHALGEWPARLILDEDPVDPGMTPEDRKATHAFTTEYNEGVFAGYRWFDEKNIEPRFPFGYGLSYTTFKLGDLKLSLVDENVLVSLLLKNTGERAGAEVVQVYVAPKKSSVPRAPQELKGFQKIFLQPGESQLVQLRLGVEAFRFWHPEKNKWVVEPGDFEIRVGTSSRNLVLRDTIAVPQLLQ